MKHFSLIAFFAGLAAFACSGQKPEPLTPEVQSQTIHDLLSDMKEGYVFPKLADESATKLNENLAAGAYEDLDGPTFAKRLTTDLQSVCHDAHLRVRYSAELLPVRQHANEPSKAEIEAGKRFDRAVNGGVAKAEILEGNVGYLELLGFLSPDAAGKPIEAAMRFLANSDALVLDLRRNGGGDPRTVQLLCSYFFSGEPVHLNDIYFRPTNQTTQFWTHRRVPGPRFEGKPIYVLTSKWTASGAEECAYDLQNLHRAKILGESTWGGANPGGSYRLNDHFSIFVPSGRAINPYTKTNWEGTGVIPDVSVSADKALQAAKKMTLQELLGKASFPDDKERIQEALGALKDS